MILAGLFWLGSISASDRVLTISRIVREENNFQAEPIEPARFVSRVAKQNLLQRVRSQKFGLPDLSLNGPGVTPVDTIRIVAIRVEFKAEIPDDPTTTGQGLFDRRDTLTFLNQEGHLFDSAPHLKKYFSAHLRSLGNYWRSVSNGRLVLTYDVFPQTETNVYQLPVVMGYYGSAGPYRDSGVVKQLSTFFHDAIHLADSLSPEIQFANYDAVIVFHAGSDRQNDLGNLGTPTPNDLYTGFIILGDTVKVDNDSAGITGGIIAPESPSQDNRIVGLNGILAHEFGHQLGLVDMYNTTSTPPISTLGDFSLMDNFGQDIGIEYDFGRGPKVAFGLVPTLPDAWSRAYLGFVDSLAEIRNSRDIKIIAAAMQRTGTEVVKVPIGSLEYFLIENRQKDIDAEPDTFLLVDSATYVILGPVNRNRQYNNEYDLLLPGSGLAIYHVDENVAYLPDPDYPQFTRFEVNSVNTDPKRRMVTLMEADGIVDFGGNYFTGFGRAEDLFRLGNNSRFGPNTNPSSRTSFKANSHILIDSVSVLDTLMRCNIFTNFLVSQQPLWAGQDSIAFPLILDTTEKRPYFFTVHQRYLLGWDHDFQPIYSNTFTEQVRELNGNMVSRRLPVFAIAPVSLTAGPSAGDLNNDGSVDVVAFGSDGYLYAWTKNDLDNNNLADQLPGFPLDLKETCWLAPVMVNYDSSSAGRRIIIGAKSGLVWVISDSGQVVDTNRFGGPIIGLSIDENGTIYLQYRGISDTSYLWQGIQPVWKQALLPASGRLSGLRVFGPVTGDLDRDSLLESVLTDNQGTVYVYDFFGNRKPGFPVSVDQPIVASPILVDVDGNGYLDIVAISKSRVIALNRAGIVVTDFPIPNDYRDTSGLSFFAPVFGNTDFDLAAELVLGSVHGNLLSFDRTNRQPYPFPFSLGTEIGSNLVLNQISRSFQPYLQIVVRGKDGFVYGYEIPNQPLLEPGTIWAMTDYNAQHTNSVPSKFLPPLPPSSGPLVQDKSFFPYPNPAGSSVKLRYYLNEDAEVTFKFFDLAGNLVDQKFQNGAAARENDLAWDCSNLAPGVYLCRMEVKNISKSAVLFTKIAVVR